MKKQKKVKKAKVHSELEGFDISINSFGEITRTFNIDKLNDFLSQQVDDKKMKDRKGKYAL